MYALKSYKFYYYILLMVICIVSMHSALFGSQGRYTYLSEGFEDTSFPPLGWQRSTNEWDRTTNSAYVISGVASARVRKQYIANEVRLITPLLRVTNESVLSFKAKRSSISYSEQIKVRYSMNGTDWNLIQTCDLTSNPVEFIINLSALTTGDYYFCFDTYSTDQSSNNKTYIIDDVGGLILTSSITAASVYGYVKRIDNNLPVIGAMLSIGNLQTQSDSSGFYNFDSLDSGNYTLTCNAQGYNQNSINIELTNGQTLIHDFYLYPIELTPSVPVGISIHRNGTSFILDWDDCLNAQSYHLYAADYCDSTYQLIKNTSVSSCWISEAELINAGINSEKVFIKITSDSDSIAQ